MKCKSYLLALLLPGLMLVSIIASLAPVEAAAEHSDVARLRAYSNQVVQQLTVASNQMDKVTDSKKLEQAEGHVHSALVHVRNAERAAERVTKLARQIATNPKSTAAEITAANKLLNIQEQLTSELQSLVTQLMAAEQAKSLAELTSTLSTLKTTFTSAESTAHSAVSAVHDLSLVETGNPKPKHPKQR